MFWRKVNNMHCILPLPFTGLLECEFVNFEAFHICKAKANGKSNMEWVGSPFGAL
jgi:hypothetical protein